MKITKRSGYHLIVLPAGAETSLNDADHQITLEHMRLVEKYVNRHVDGIVGTGIRYTTDQVCSFCGMNWTEATETDVAEFGDLKAGQPVCCDAAIAEWKAAR